MKKNGMLGIAALLLWASLLTLLALVFFGEGTSLGELFRGFLHAVPLLFAGFYLLVFLFVKESRLRMLLFLAAGAALGLFLNSLNLSRGLWILCALGFIILYLLLCVFHNYCNLQKALQPLNKAALAYQKDRDGEAYLAALERYTPALPKGSTVKRADIGVIAMQEHFDCEKIQVLGDMGRLEERRALIERLRRETKSPELSAWLNEKEAEFGMDYQSN